MTSLKNQFIYFLGLITFAIINILAINNYAYDANGKVHCDNYVLNTYLYVMLGFIIMAMVILVDERFEIFSSILLKYGLLGMLGITIVMILFIILLRSTQNQFLAHTYWFIVLVILGCLLSIPIQLYGMIDMNIIYIGFAITILITGVMGYIGYKYGKAFITTNFDNYLTWALILLVLASFAGLFINIPNYWVYISIAGVIIFSLLLLSYNNKIRKNGETCKVPNYPSESFGLIIKIANLLQDVLYLVARTRSRR
jgi:FtsH-binding integral membrane protein